MSKRESCPPASNTRCNTSSSAQLQFRSVSTLQRPRYTSRSTFQISQHIADANERPALAQYVSDAPARILRAAADGLLDEQRASRERFDELQLQISPRDVGAAREGRGPNNRYAEADQILEGGFGVREVQELWAYWGVWESGVRAASVTMGNTLQSAYAGAAGDASFASRTAFARDASRSMSATTRRRGPRILPDSSSASSRQRTGRLRYLTVPAAMSMPVYDQPTKHWTRWYALAKLT